MKAVIILLLTALLCSTSNAGLSRYECQALATLALKKDGVLRQDEVWNGAAFVVNRISGQIEGDVNNLSWPEIRVIERGTDLSAFAVIWISSEMPTDPNASKSGYLEIQEWVDSDVKPFVMVFAPYVITGTCT